jgi:hypothetical protein
MIYPPLPTGNTTMQMLVDADACPAVLKDMLFRAAPASIRGGPAPYSPRDSNRGDWIGSSRTSARL